MRHFTRKESGRGSAYIVYLRDVMDECQQPHLGGFFLIPGDPEAVCKMNSSPKVIYFLK